MRELYIRQSSHSGRSVAVLASGGIDSDILIVEMSRRFKKTIPIFIRQGLAWEKAELYWLRRFLAAMARPGLAPLVVLDLPMQEVYRSHWSLGGKPVPGAHSADKAVFLPGRNLLLGTKAAVFCATQKIESLAWGVLSGNPFPDATPHFFRRFSGVLSQGLGHSLQILTPYRALTKIQVLRRRGDSPLNLSFSCLAPNRMRHCGKCNKCFERQQVFNAAGMVDPTVYARAR